MNKKIFLVILLIVTLIIVVRLTINEEALLCDLDKASRIEIINEFEKQWNEFEKDILIRPVLGSTTWQSPDYYQFIGKNRVLIAFEDGHIIIMAIIEYNCVEGFSLIEDGINQPHGFPFDNSFDWKEVINNYGDEEYPTYTYVKSMIIEGDFIEFDEWTEVEEDIFVR